MKTQLSHPHGEFEFDASDGSLIRISPPGKPGVSVLLGEEERTWHHPPRRWGKGFVITDRGSARWHRPRGQETLDPLRLVYDLSRVGLTLVVRRTLTEEGLEERFVLSNGSQEPVQIGSLAVSTPFRDIYPSAVECLKGAFHAHVWTGGANSWVWAMPMHGRGPGFALDLREGELWSYSIENRDHFISSNIRGHIYLHLTDRARNKRAFGGQPEWSLPPGGELSWMWRLSWFADFARFEASRGGRDVRVEALAAHVGEPLVFPAGSDETWEARSEGSSVVAQAGSGFRVSAKAPGVYWLERKGPDARSRVAVLFHRRLGEIVRRRVEFVLRHQQAAAGEPTREGAFLPYDRETGLTEIGGAWGDWSDGRERVAMALLVQAAVERGWSPEGADAAIERFKDYAARYLVTEENTVKGGSYENSTKRLYNYSWMSEFFRNEYRRTGRIEDLRKAADILEAYYTHGGENFLGFLFEIDVLVGMLRQAGEEVRSDSLRAHVICQARNFREMGDNLPNHEVNYEQSIVAPLALLLISAQRLLPDEDWRPSIEKVLDWLAAFAGQQPDVRLREIPLRHWDGFWFGKSRLWGDVFPHYWSVLSGAAYMEAAGLYPDRREELELRGDRIFRSNLVHFQDDGFASCAFVYPSCVNTLPAHRFDALANDQDWALVWLLRFSERLPWAESV